MRPTPTSTRRKVAVLTAAPLVLLATLAATPTAAGATAEDGFGAAASRAAVRSEVRLGNATEQGVVGSLRARPSARQVATATFNIRYSGFSAEARTAFQRAADIWATQVTSSVPITVDASFGPLPPGALGSAGPGSLWRDFAGAPAPSTWYPEAIANKRAGRQLSADADVVAQFSSSFDGWWFGAGAAPGRKIDFTAVVLHELGHGLGFLGAGEVRDGRGSVRTGGFPISYDRFTENTAGTALLAFPNRSTQLGNQLRSNGVYFDTRAVRNSNSGNRARLFAPSRWQPGSSYSHLNEATYKPGSPNALMTPVINRGETIRTPGPITNAIFSSIGW